MAVNKEGFLGYKSGCLNDNGTLYKFPIAIKKSLLEIKENQTVSNKNDIYFVNKNDETNVVICSEGTTPTGNFDSIHKEDKSLYLDTLNEYILGTEPTGINYTFDNENQTITNTIGWEYLNNKTYSLDKIETKNLSDLFDGQTKSITNKLYLVNKAEIKSKYGKFLLPEKKPPINATDNIIYANGIYMCSYGQYIYISRDGTNWDESYKVITDEESAGGLQSGSYLRGYGTNGSILIQLVAGHNPRILTSTDGRNWNTQIISDSMECITYDNGRFILTSSTWNNPTNKVYHSTDGLNWSSYTLPVSYYYWSQAIWLKDKWVFYTYKNSSPQIHRIYTSTNGTSNFTLRKEWTTTGTFYRVGSNGNRMVVMITTTGKTTGYYSDDGITWNEFEAPGAIRYFSSAQQNVMYYNSNTNKILTLFDTSNGTIKETSDFINWTDTNLNTSALPSYTNQGPIGFVNNRLYTWTLCYSKYFNNENINDTTFIASSSVPVGFDNYVDTGHTITLNNDLNTIVSFE